MLGRSMGVLAPHRVAFAADALGCRLHLPSFPQNRSSSREREALGGENQCCASRIISPHSNRTPAAPRGAALAPRHWPKA
jgi:hypothetical protein